MYMILTIVGLELVRIPFMLSELLIRIVKPTFHETYTFYLSIMLLPFFLLCYVVALWMTYRTSYSFIYRGVDIHGSIREALLAVLDLARRIKKKIQKESEHFPENNAG